MPTHKLTFTPHKTDLSDTAKSFLEQSFMQEDYKSYWISIDVLLEDLGNGSGDQPGSYGTVFTGVELPKNFNWSKKKFTLKDVPKAWWKLMKFPPKVERAMKAFWKKYPTGEVEWSW